MEILSLQCGAAVPGQAPATAERSEGSGASAFAALLEGMQSVAMPEEQIAPEGGGDDIEEMQEPEDQVVLDALPESPPLASPLLDVDNPATAEEAEASTLRDGREVPSAVTGDGIDIVPPGTALGAVGKDAAAVGAMEAVDFAQSNPDESAVVEEASPTPTATVRESREKPAQPAPYVESTSLNGVEFSAAARAPQPEKPAANRTGDKPDKPDKPDLATSFDLPDQTFVSISIHEGKAAPAPPEVHLGMRVQAPVEPRHVLRQLGEKLAEGADGVVEIALSPEELGKVRLVIAPGEKPAVTVFADRPETFDLLRRNAEALDKELRNAGIFGADISFSGGSDGRDRSHGAVRDLRGSDRRDQTMIFVEQAMPARPRPVADRRIDIRI